MKKKIKGRTKLNIVNVTKNLEQIILDGAPDSGSNPLDIETPQSYAGVKKFSELPISDLTKAALAKNNFKNMTAIQRATIPHALCGRDILGAAKTGSGKTLAFLIPFVEKLYRQLWSPVDGLGGLIISPTRELALQIFDELRKVGEGHDLSAGLLIGGKDVKEEQKYIQGMCVLVCTPGRLLQHFEQTVGIQVDSLNVLVIDEADRCLDMGFASTLNSIIEYIPSGRQTMLFSATLSASVQDLARLSLKSPERLSVHRSAAAATPLKLQQRYTVCQADDKLTVLWSFIKGHLNCKTLVFVSTCKQARFIFEAIRRLRPGIPIAALHGSMKTMKRLAVYTNFQKTKHMVLISTDLAARGLDIGGLQWVVQLDAPADTDTYIHRVGRTARFMDGGRALLLLLPSEAEAFTNRLKDASVPVTQQSLNPSKLTPIAGKISSLVAQDTELKAFAQSAIVAYLRAYYLQADKKVFDVSSINLANLASSYGLLQTPKIKFLNQAQKAKQQEMKAQQGPKQKLKEDKEKQGSSDEENDGGMYDKTDKQSNTHEGLLRHNESDDLDSRKSKSKRKDAKQANVKGQESEDDGEELLQLVEGGAEVLGAQLAGADGDAGVVAEPTEATKKRGKIKIDKTSGGRVVFNEKGEAMDPLQALANQMTSSGGTGGQGHLSSQQFSSASERFAAQAKILKQRDALDAKIAKQALKEAYQRKKAQRKGEEHAQHAITATLAGPKNCPCDSHKGSSDEFDEYDSDSTSQGPDDVRYIEGRDASDGGDRQVDIDLDSDSDAEVEHETHAAMAQRKINTNKISNGRIQETNGEYNRAQQRGQRGGKRSQSPLNAVGRHIRRKLDGFEGRQDVDKLSTKELEALALAQLSKK